MLLNEIEAAKQDLLGFGVKDVSLQTCAPVAPGTLQEAEAEIGVSFPTALQGVYLHETGGLRFAWNTEVFGPECKRGCAWLLGPKEIVEERRNLLGTVADAKAEGLDRVSEGYGALVKDWPAWVPVFRFPSGDCFCLDNSSGASDPVIVFLEHDVMDQGPNLHGLRVAGSFTELVARWSKVLFVDVYDWTKVVRENGMDEGADVFSPLRQVPRAKSGGPGTGY